MTIKSEVDNLHNVKTGLRQAIQSNKGELTTDDRFEVYPSAINSMQNTLKTDTTGILDYIMDANNIITLPANITKIRDYAFSDNTSLEAVNIKATSVIELGKHVFKGTKMAQGTGKIYVMNSLVNAYKTADGWKDYASQIVSVNTLPSSYTRNIIETLDEHRTVSYIAGLKIEDFSK